MRVALATSQGWPDLTPDDREVLLPLRNRGLQAEPALWTDPGFSWRDYDAVIIRSCWDYHLRSNQFLQWIDSLESSGCQVWNPASLIHWNADKAYLRELENKGISIIPTSWCDHGESFNVKTKMQELGWQRAVIKPRISATAYRTRLVSVADAALAQVFFDELKDRPGVMLQKFMSNIVEQGEWSLMFFGRQFSHAVLKTPKRGDFRVQHDFGGESRAAAPPAFILDAATRAVQAVGPMLYARVDGVVDEDQFRIMELELIEPAMFLSYDPASPERFAEAIAAALNSRSLSPH